MSGYWEKLVGPAFDRAREHRPHDREAMRAAAVELRRRGLTTHDIAQALELTERAVHGLLEAG